jgi:hypothetical protein
VAQIVPLSIAPNQALTVSLDIDSGVVTLELQVRYNELAGYWLLTIKDRLGVLLLDSIPMICGAWPAANLLQQAAYLKIGSAYIVNASGVAQDSPGATNLGSDFILIWDDTPAL